MKLLFIGTEEIPRRLHAQLEHAGLTEAVQCADETSALEALHSAEPGFDWVFVDQSVDRAGLKRVGDAVASGSQRTQLVSVHAVDATAMRLESARPLMCSVKRTAEGLQLLHCALQRARRDPAAHPHLVEAIGDRSCGFEYHAPCKRHS